MQFRNSAPAYLYELTHRPSKSFTAGITDEDFGVVEHDDLSFLLQRHVNSHPTWSLWGGKGLDASLRPEEGGGGGDGLLTPACESGSVAITPRGPPQEKNR